MAFPTVSTTAIYNDGTSTATHDITLPASISSGMLLVIFLRCSAAFSTAPTGWTLDSTAGAHTLTRTADGAEGATVTVTPDFSGRLAAVSYAISGWSDFEITAVASSDPASLTPTFGSGDILWLVAHGAQRSDWSVTAPTNYTNLLTGTNASNSATTRVRMESARRELNGSTEDPGTFTVTGTTSSPRSITLAVAPVASGGATVTPGAISCTTTVGTATMSTGSTISPTAVTCVASVAGGTVSASATVAAVAVAVVSTVGAPAMIGGATIAAATVAGTVSLPPPTVTAGSAINATATPSAILCTTTVGTVTLSAGSTIAATSLAITATMPTPSVTAGSTVSATVTPTAIAVTVTVGAATPTETTWTTDFPGSSLPSGWTWEGAVGSVAVAASRATITAPDGTSRDSIFSTGSSDGSLGIKKAVTLHSGDLDIAIQVDTDISNKMGLGVNLLVFGATTADAVRFGSYAPANDTDNEYGKYYIYTRSGGSGAVVSNLTWGGSNIPGVASPGWMSGSPSWLRVAYASGTGIWTFYASTNGATWRTLSTATRSFTPVTFKVGVTTTDTDGGDWDVSINKVIDVTEYGSTDLRDSIVEYTRSTIAVIDPTVDVSLPAGWVDDSNGSGTLTMIGGGTGAGVLRFSDQQSDTSTNAPTRGGGGSSRMRYSTPTTSGNAGLLMRVEADNGLASAYMTPGLVSYSATDGWIDQYAGGSGYGLEINASSTVRRPIRTTDPLDGNVAPVAAFSTGLDESPYCHLEQVTAAGTLVASARWFRMEVVGRRYRVREWADGDAEPTTWGVFDGQEQTFQTAGLELVPAVSLSHNAAGASEFCTVDLTYCEFYDLALTGTTSAGTTIAATSVTTSTSIPTPTVTAGSSTSATATPSAILCTTTLGTPTLSAGSRITASPVTVTTSMPTPSVSAGVTRNATIAASPVLSTTTLGAPTLSAGATVSPSPISSTTTLGTPTLSAGTTISPAPVLVVTTVSPVGKQYGPGALVWVVPAESRTCVIFAESRRHIIAAERRTLEIPDGS